MSKLTWNLETFKTLWNTINKVFSFRNMTPPGKNKINNTSVDQYAPGNFPTDLKKDDPLLIDYADNTINLMHYINTELNGIPFDSVINQYDLVPDLNTYIDIVNAWDTNDATIENHGCANACTGLCYLSCFSGCNGCTGGGSSSPGNQGGGCNAGCGGWSGAAGTVWFCRDCVGENGSGVSVPCYSCNFDTCTGTCYTSCWGGCNSCAGGCSGGCSNNCSGNCGGGCEGKGLKLSQ